MAYMCIGSGLSVITNRFRKPLHARERTAADGRGHRDPGRQRRGARRPDAQRARKPWPRICGQRLAILAALCRPGTTEISRVYHIDRGYESIETKFSALGADIR
jgi:UDP-N-acetylglucosamine 1-carboxyvinyltransferase